jgi:hypothetical protein
MSGSGLVAILRNVPLIGRGIARTLSNLRKISLPINSKTKLQIVKAEQISLAYIKESKYQSGPMKQIEDIRKAQAKARQRRYRVKNREKIRKYNLKNKERMRKYGRAWRLKNKEKVREDNLKNKEKMREWELKNKEHRREYQLKYRLKNKEKLRRRRIKNKEKLKFMVRRFYYKQSYKHKPLVEIAELLYQLKRKVKEHEKQNAGNNG